MKSKTLNRSKWVGQEGLNLILKPLHTSLISLFVVRFYNLSIWGEIVFFLVAIELTTTVLNWGQKSYLLRLFSEDISNISSNWLKAIYARIPILLVIILVTILTPQLNQYLLPFLGWLIFRWGAQLFDAYIQFHRKYNWSIIGEIAATGSAFGCLIFAETIHLQQLIWIFCLSSFIRFLFLLPIFPFKQISTISQTNWLTSLKQSFPFLALSVGGLLQTKGDLFVSTYFLPKQELAIYQVIISFLLLGQSLAWIILGPFQKNILRWHHNSIKKLKNTYLKIGFGATLLTVIGIYVIVQFIYKINIEEKLLVYFFVYLIIMYFYLIESQILIKNRKEKKLLLFVVYGAVANIGVSLILIPTWGIQGALLGGIIGKLLLSTLVVKQSKIIE